MATPNPANELASALQSTHVKQNPDPNYDLAPSTAASAKSPVRIRNVQAAAAAAAGTHASDLDDEIPLSVLQPVPRTQRLPPLPDMRFEQSYLARIQHCSTPWHVAWVTFVDQVFMPLTQGLVWNLLLAGWRAWNTGAKFHGAGVGARLRRWWWDVNNWKLPAGARLSGRRGEPESRVADQVRDFYEVKFANAGAD